MHDLTAIALITPSYRYSSELALCLEMFRKALPRGARLVLIEGNRPGALRASLEEQALGGNSRFLVVVREPAMLVGRKAFEEMVLALEEHPQYACILPSDIRGCHPGKTAAYFTLRHFETFVESLSEPDLAFMPYDNREPWVFIIRPEALHSMVLPDDPMEIPRVLPPAAVAISPRAYIHPFIDYYEEKREEAVSMIPEGTRCLLDIGCARGRFGQAVKQRLGCRVVGIEMNAHESGHAKELLDRVVEEDFLTADVSERFDCISCLDVIEHVTAPALFLERAAAILDPGGHLLVSVPNVGHWSIVEDLIAGRWDYLPVGILTVSHLRFFTRKSALQMIEEAGFTIIEVRNQEARMPDGRAGDMDLLEERGCEVDRESLSCLGYYILAQKPLQ